MLVDVSSILKDVGGKVDVSGNISIEDTDFLGESFHFELLEVNGKFINNGKSLMLEAEVEAKVDVNCARCRKPLLETIRFSIDEAFMQGEEPGVDEDVYMFDGHKIDISEVVYNCFFMNAPGKFLCSDDCKGICPVCGVDRNEHECACEGESIDPRWEAILSKLNNTDKD